MKRRRQSLKHFLIAFFALLSSCQKENDRPQWDLEVTGPLITANIGINQLIADSLTSTDPNGKIRLVFDETVGNLENDSLYRIPDTTLYSIFTWGLFNFTVNPGTPFYSNNKDIVLGVSGAQLTKAIIESGYIRLQIKNTLPSKVLFTYSIPEARKNGVSLVLNREVNAGSISSPSYLTEDIDFSGYTLNLTGANGTRVNSIAYNVLATSDPDGTPFQVNQGDTMVNLTTTMVDIVPSYVKGYLGQRTSTQNNSDDIGLGNLFDSGLLLLDSAKLQLDFANYIGADILGYISGIRSVNARTGIVVPLTAPSILNRNITLNRASENPGGNPPVYETYQRFVIDQSNSNITSFVENLPDFLETDIQLQLNPLGNISGSNDFVFRDKLVSTRYRLDIPMRMAATALALVDTQELSIDNLTNLDPIGDATFTVIGENGFPADIRLQLYLLNDQHQLTDSLLVPDLFPAAVTGTDFVVIAPTTTSITIPVDAARKNRILSSSYMVIKASFTTVSNPDFVDFYESYRFKFKLTADGIYSVR